MFCYLVTNTQVVNDAELIKAGTADGEYTCPMHPEVRQAGPGNCPKCGMALERAGAPSPQAAAHTEYVCPMHAQIVRSEPGSWLWNREPPLPRKKTTLNSSTTCVHSGWVCGFEDGSLKNSEAMVIKAQTSPNTEKVIAGPNRVPAHPAAGYVINQHAWVSAKWAA